MLRPLILTLLLAPAACAQIGVVQRATAHSDSGAVVLSFAAAPATRNLLVAECAYYTGTSCTAPSGWTQAASASIQCGTVGLATYTHAVAAGEANSYSFPQNNHATVSAYELSGTAFYAPSNGAAAACVTTANATSAATPAVTPTVARTLPLYLFAGDDDNATGVSPGTYLASPSGSHPAASAYGALTTDTTTAQAATFALTGTNAQGVAVATLLIAPYNTTPIAPVANAAGLGGPHYSSIIGQAIPFDGSASYDPKQESLTYLWTFGDGSTSTAVQASHTYTTAATFNASLKVTNTDGLSSTASFTVIVQAGCGNAVLGHMTALNFDLSPNDVWHQDIHAAPVDPNDAAWHSNLNANFAHMDFGTKYGNYGIPFDVADSRLTPLIPISIGVYAGESDVTLYPYGPTTSIESAPADCTGNGDNHAIVFDRHTCAVYETYHAQRCSTATPQISADTGTVWDATISNQQRPFDFTSVDLAGLSVLSGLIRYDEVASGHVDHAFRWTNNVFACAHYVNGTGQGAYMLPATHSGNGSQCSGSTDANNGAGFVLGQRIRLKASYDLTGFSVTNQVIAAALKTYGGILADLGSSLYFQGTPDPRWDTDDIAKLNAIPKSAFELVQQGTIYASDRYPTGTPPTIASFSAAQPVIAAGQCTVLPFAITGASYQFIDKVGFVRSPPTVCPSVTTTYTLTASNYYLAGDDGTGDGHRPNQTVTVTVLPFTLPFFSGNVVVGNQQ